jgi:hypothetical protein
MCENDSVGAKWCGVYLNRGCRPTSPVSLVNPPRDMSDTYARPPPSAGRGGRSSGQDIFGSEEAKLRYQVYR